MGNLKKVLKTEKVLKRKKRLDSETKKISFLENPKNGYRRKYKVAKCVR